jgi:cell wall-associated NlpC family hydrolase
MRNFMIRFYPESFKPFVLEARIFAGEAFESCKLGFVKALFFAIFLALGFSSALAGSYTVQPKDTLYSIAKKFNLSVSELQKLNQLTTNSVSVGQVLIVPDPQKVHVVTAKETLFSISKKYGVTVQTILEANKLTSPELKIGQRLIIPNTSLPQPSVQASSSPVKPTASSSTTKPSASTPPKLPTLASAPKPQISSTVEKPSSSNTIKPVPAKPEIVPTKPENPPTKPALATPTPNANPANPDSVPPSNASSLPARPSTPATLKPPAAGNVKPVTSSANTNAVLPNARGSDAPIVVPVLKTAPMPNLSTPPTAPVMTSTIVDVSSSTPVEQPLPEASSDAPELFYTVVAGETLYRIALRYKVTIESIRAANKLSSDSISAGQRIKIPVASTAFIAPSSSSQLGVSEVSERYLGVTYRYGGTTANGLDCSGFVQIVFAELGLKLPRTSALQFQAGIEVAREDLTEGDLVFFDTTGRGVSHVGIYLKDNQFIHAASNPGKVTISSLLEKYWQPKYLGARRVLTDD